MNGLKALILVILITVVVPVDAAEYDQLLLKTQASIFPKIILLDKDIETKIASNEIVISIIHSINDHVTAVTLKNLMEESYKENLGNKKLIIRLIDFDKFEETDVATAYFIMQGSSKIHEKVTAHAAKNKRVCFSYNYKDFENNALISLLIKEKTYVYLNKSAIHDYDIKFLPLFYKIVKVLE